jgi:rod shape-determining protein MreD
VGGGRKLTSIYLTLPVLALIVLVQATLLARLRFLEAGPNALLAAVVSWSLLRGIDEGIIWGFIGGLGLDLVAGLPLGTSPLALMSISFLAALGETNVFLGNLFLPAIIVALATPLYGWIVLLSQQLQGIAVAEGHLPVDWASATLRIIGPELLLNVLTVGLVYPPLRWLAGRLGADSRWPPFDKLRAGSFD